MEVINKAVDLMEYTYRVTSNRKKYPQKYVQLIREIQRESMNIYKNLFRANRKNSKTEKVDRLKLQADAISGCDELSCFIELSARLNLIDSSTMDHWQEKISSIKYMAISWRKSEVSN